MDRGSRIQIDQPGVSVHANEQVDGLCSKLHIEEAFKFELVDRLIKKSVFLPI